MVREKSDAAKAATIRPELDALNGARRRRKRSIRKWVKRQIYFWLGAKAQPVIDFLVACLSIMRIRSSYAHILSDQKKIKATNAWLLTEQETIKAHNDYLLREYEWLKSRNEKLLAEHDRISNGLASDVVETRPAKMKMAPGMMSNFDIEAVTGLAQKVPAGGTVVDVGSLLGLSASLWCIHSEAGRIVCVDPWKYEPWMESFSQANGPITKEAFLANVPDERIETIQGYSPECGKDWTTPIDLYWEDGDHINPGCGESIRFWSSFVKPGGIACGHDYHLPDVKKEAEALAAHWGSELHIYGTVWWVRNGPEA